MKFKFASAVLATSGVMAAICACSTQGSSNDVNLSASEISDESGGVEITAAVPGGDSALVPREEGDRFEQQRAVYSRWASALEVYASVLRGASGAQGSARLDAMFARIDAQIAEFQKAVADAKPSVGAAQFTVDSQAMGERIQELMEKAR